MEDWDHAYIPRWEDEPLKVDVCSRCLGWRPRAYIIAAWLAEIGEIWISAICSCCIKADQEKAKMGIAEANERGIVV